MLIGNKDVDLYEILMPLDDNSLLNFCKTAIKQEYEKNLCNDDTFWKIRTKLNYPLAYEINLEKNELKWKEYYLRIVYYKDKMEREFGFIFTDGDVKKYYQILKLDEENAEREERKPEYKNIDDKYKISLMAEKLGKDLVIFLKSKGRYSDVPIRRKLF